MDEVSTNTSDGVRSGIHIMKCERVGAIENWSGLDVDSAADPQKAGGEFASAVIDSSRWPRVIALVDFLLHAPGEIYFSISFER